MDPNGAVFACAIDRERSCLIAVIDPRPLHRDLELHLLSIGAVDDPFTVTVVEDGLSALALWQVSRPRFETHGWTISLREPRLNLFFTGNARENTVVGRAFHENLAESARSLFFVQTSRPSKDLQTSSVEVEGVDIFGMVEQYSHRSDQVPVRFFHQGDADRVAFVTPFPDGDRTWLEGAEAAEVFARVDSGTLKPISEGRVEFRCGCDTQRMTRVVFDAYKGDANELFQGDPAVEAECPHCGARHQITREKFEAIRSA